MFQHESYAARAGNAGIGGGAVGMALGATQKKAAGEIESSMARIGGELDTVRMRLNQLTERLSPVLRASPPATESASPRPVMATALGEQAEKYACSLRELQCQLDDLLNRLDL